MRARCAPARKVPREGGGSRSWDPRFRRSPATSERWRNMRTTRVERSTWLHARPVNSPRWRRRREQAGSRLRGWSGNFRRRQRKPVEPPTTSNFVGANGEAFADRLAYAEGGQGHSVNPVVAGIVTAATAWTGLVADMQQSATTDVSGDAGTHDIERAASQHDHWEAANQMATPSSAAIHPADPRKKRS